MITKTDYNWLPMPRDAKNYIQYLSDRGYSAPIDLAGPVRLFGRDNRYIAIGPDFMISVLQDKRGDLEYGGRPKQLPADVVNPDDGYLIVPFGEQMFVRTCGTMAKLWTLKDRTVISAVTKNAFTKKLIVFQIHFFYNTEIIEIHYRKSMTGNSTVIGACGEPNEYFEWGCNRYEILDKTAIRIDTSLAGVTIEDRQPEENTGPSGHWTPPSKPKTPVADDDPPVVDAEWREVWSNDKVRVMEKK